MDRASNLQVEKGKEDSHLDIGHQELLWKHKIAYGLCDAGEVIPYNLVLLYFLFFLTDIAFVSAVLAGIIMAVAMAWDAITDPIVGSLSDKSKSPYGKRISFMMYSIIPLALTVYLMFAPFRLEGSLQFVYYLLVALALRTFFTTYDIPYVSLGAEITPDYRERNIIRAMTMAFAYPILLLVSSGPMWIWSIAGNQGLSDRQAWGYVGLVFAILLVILCSLGLYGLKDFATDKFYSSKTETSSPKISFVKNTAELLKIKAYRTLVYFSIVFLFGFAMTNMLIVYVMTYNANLSASQQGVFWVLYSLFVVSLLPLIIKLFDKIGRKETVHYAVSIKIVCFIFLSFIGINSFAMMLVFGFVLALSASTFFTAYMGFAYDCTEIDEFINGKRREGSIVAIIFLCTKIGAAVAMLVTGLLLDLYGYDGVLVEQPAGVLNGILKLGTLYPAILFLVAIIIFSTYPVKKDNFKLLYESLLKKRNNQDYTTEGFEELLKKYK